MAKHAHSTLTSAVQDLAAEQQAQREIVTGAIGRRRRRQTIQQQRKHLEAALEHLLAAVEAVVGDLDALDGDADLEDGHDREPVCEDEGAQCDDEGAIETDQNTGDDEPDQGELCHWQDEGDQTVLRPHVTTPVRRPHPEVRFGAVDHLANAKRDLRGLQRSRVMS